MVGGLVQQEDVRLEECDLGERDAALLTPCSAHDTVERQSGGKEGTKGHMRPLSIGMIPQALDTGPRCAE